MAAPARVLPKLPKAAWTIYGEVPIRLVPHLIVDGEPCFGSYDGLTREILIRENMPLVNQWRTLFHERTHLDCEDIGVVTSYDQIEAICNAVAAARMAEMLHSPTPVARAGWIW